MAKHKKQKQIKDKSVSQRVHAKRRAFQRHGVLLNRAAMDKIIALIQSGRSRLILRQSNTRAIHIVAFGGVDLPVVYDSKRKTIATVLETEHIDQIMKGKKNDTQIST